MREKFRGILPPLLREITTTELDRADLFLPGEAAKVVPTHPPASTRRQQVENFVQHLADWAEKDRNALLCQLNSYLPREDKEGAA